ncbi:MAG: hypothetical protein M0P58_05595 [Bacteroidales bacterium]|jgi:hypothetical protein|nr:hypothetical protein [Bacteroidales bacterium]
MKKSERYRVKTDRIRSLEDIAAEKARLKFEIRLKEEHIHNNYQRILDAFTLRNLASSLVTEISTNSSIVSKAISIGKSFIEKRKKKKKEKLSGGVSGTSLPGH